MSEIDEATGLPVLPEPNLFFRVENAGHGYDFVYMKIMRRRERQGWFGRKIALPPVEVVSQIITRSLAEQRHSNFELFPMAHEVTKAQMFRAAVGALEKYEEKRRKAAVRDLANAAPVLGDYPPKSIEG